MSQILNKIRDIDPNNGEVVKDALSSFFLNLNKHTELDCIRWLRALENIITRFPKYCMSHRNTAETYLTHFLDSSNFFYVLEAAKCAHALQQVRPPQEKSATAKSCWRDEMRVLCNSVHLLLRSIFPNLVDLYNGNSENEEPQVINSPLLTALTNISNVKHVDKNVERQTLLCTRLRNVFVFIQAMLVEIYPVPKPVQPQTILEALIRALSIAPSSVSNVDITVIKIQVLRTVDALIACLGANLIPFSSLVIRFAMQTLKWTSENSSNESSKVRCAAYRSLSRWLGTLRAHRCAGAGARWPGELAAHVARDVTPARHVVQLTMSTQPTKNLSKKARKRLANSMLQGGNMASHMPGEKNKVVVPEDINDEVAIAALECAETFLTVCGIFLKPTTHKLFQERLVRECYSLESYSSERALWLLRALEATRKTTPATVAPPTQYCLQLYSVLINSQQREISKFCSQALLDIRMHLHCSPPSINFALEVADDKQKRAELKKSKMQQRNKAALDAFLENRVTTENSNEIITILDEPSNKKPRLEEDTLDKISVSSDSVSSVEISDESDGDVELVQENDKANEKENENGDISIEIVVDTSSKNNDIPESNKQTVYIPNDVVDTVENNTQIEVNTVTEVSNNHEKDAPSSQDDGKDNIYEAKTQLPINASNETVDEDMPLSAEIAYDLPATVKEVPVLEKNDDDNLPSTNDTDDIQITCGQVVKNSQDGAEKAKTECETPKVNGNKSPEKIMIDDEVLVPEVTIKIGALNDTITVDDMMADFVDEVNEEGTV
ncbi:uncharacterized protein LOC106136689 [Amyelois transitella]|uniref:uncharacterized protein LOC106136689 n=1 Tax=Amyelois transitella TaxID=680683 RepID=UPI00298FB162|nr:uncharacterized protein LOC106136689 [Amyelois transitella]